MADRLRNLVDLHTHSTASDGNCPPGRLIECAEAAKLAGVALTDHDTTAGLAEASRAAERFEKLRFVPGIEVSARFPEPGTMHILGLGIDPQSESLRRFAQDMVDARNDRNPKIVEKLQALGVDISMSDVVAVADEFHGEQDRAVVSRMHIAEAMRRARAVESIRDAFDRYIGSGKPAYVAKDRIAPGEVVQTLRRAGGLVILAHPVELRCDNLAQLRRIVRELIEAGLDGIEAYHSNQSAVQTRMYLDLACELKIGVTGGSDYHGAGKPGVKLGKPSVPIEALPPRFVERLALGGRN